MGIGWGYSGDIVGIYVMGKHNKQYENMRFAG